ncbi:MAG: sodium:proton antiporter NhaD [Campylobacterota bacterium]|nr:sodium:proton antiporter NhaD [Campylobacterota bacterium]
MIYSFVGFASIVLFIIAYLMISFEEKISINKSKPALLAGILIYVMIASHYVFYGMDIAPLQENMHHLIVEIASIYFFLFVAMTYVESLIERNVFEALKYRLLQKGYNFKKLFWVTGFIAFFLSPVADNLTTALVLSTVLLTLEHHNKQFLILGAINVVVAANAGGAWSPFGDITTLMVWTAGKGTFSQFLFLFPASFIGWMATAYLLSRFLPEGSPTDKDNSSACRRPEDAKIKRGGVVIIFLGILTIVMAVSIHQILHLPAFWGMMLGLGVLGFYSTYLKKKYKERIWIFRRMAEVENDTLLFFFGLLSAVAGLSYIGYIGMAANIYNELDPFWVNILIGILSAVVDNIPLMFAVLKADPVMDTNQWMLITLTAGIGGSLISFGSAAGVGVMGRLRGIYTVGAHMRYACSIMVGYIISIVIFYLQFEVFGVSLPK